MLKYFANHFCAINSSKENLNAHATQKVHLTVRKRREKAGREEEREGGVREGWGRGAI